MAQSSRIPWVEQVREVAAEVVVLDLDGVVRVFEDRHQAGLIEHLGMSAAELMSLAFALPVLPDTVRGRAPFARWVEDIRAELQARGVAPNAAERGLQAWLGYRGTPVPEVVALAADLEQRGIPCFVFTNGTDAVPDELRRIGLGHLVPRLLNSADLGVAKPDLAAYRAAHDALEQRLSRPVPTSAVLFADDRAANVAAAETFGWRACTPSMTCAAARPADAHHPKPWCIVSESPMMLQCVPRSISLLPSTSGPANSPRSAASHCPPCSPT